MVFDFFFYIALLDALNGRHNISVNHAYHSHKYSIFVNGYNYVLWTVNAKHV